MTNILFVCSVNKQRSKTASDYFSIKYSGFKFDSGGTNLKMCKKEGTQALTEELMEWADMVFVMEKKHQKLILDNGGLHFKDKIIILHIPDKYQYYQKELIVLLEEKVQPHLTE